MDLNIVKLRQYSVEKALISALKALSLNLFSDPSPLGGGIKICKFIEFPL